MTFNFSCFVSKYWDFIKTGSSNIVRDQIKMLRFAVHFGTAKLQKDSFSQASLKDKSVLL